MKFYLLLLATLFFHPLHAVETDPNNMKLLQCMAIYDYDFVAEELGLSVSQVGQNGKEEKPLSDEEVEKRHYEQASRFAHDGKLISRLSAKEQKTLKKDLAQRCQIIAETVLELMILKGRLQSANGNYKPVPLDQSF